MWWTPERAHAVTGGIWMIGLGVLFATNYWFPGILFLVRDHRHRRGFGPRRRVAIGPRRAVGPDHRLLGNDAI